MPKPHISRGGYVVAALFLLYLLSTLAWVRKGPKVWVDEPWMSIPSYQLITEGKLNNPVIVGDLGREKHNLDPSMTYALSLAASFKAFGVGVFQGRLVSALAMFATTVLAFLLARRLFDERVALLGVLFLMVNNIAFVSAATIRAETMVALVAMLSCYLFVLGDERERLRYFALAGLVAGVGLHVHPNAFLGLVAICTLFLYRFGFRGLFRAPFWTFAGFVLMGVAPYAAYVFIEDYDNDFRDFLAQIGGRAKPLAESNFLVDTLKAEFRRYTLYVFFPKRAFIALLEGVALVYALASRSRSLRLLGILVAVHLVLFPFLIVNRTARYFTVLMPFVSILVARLMMDLAGNPRSLVDLRRSITGGRRLGLVAVLLGLMYFGNQLGGNAWLVYKHRHNEYYSFIEKLDAHIPDGARIWGSITFWFGFKDNPYSSQYSYAKDIDTFRPEYVILYDDDTWGKTSSTTGRQRDISLMADTRHILETLAEERGTFVAMVKDPVYGEVEIQRIDWSDARSRRAGDD
ncbi:glycosyltransferase family 39 protein [bacterium]|nr:glycosyltransferase family 39 protein [bacterium]MBU1074015.1 glycosyltransferase family 39 protein [bacterium]MBU1677222.1 glycosyltransferase family 39 protein [bacterium]